MSAAAMLIRVQDLGLVPEASVEYAFRTYAQAWRTKEPDPIRAHKGLGAFERPIRFEQLVYRALSEELIAPARAALLLKRPLSAIETEPSTWIATLMREQYPARCSSIELSSTSKTQ
jgi:hypothetical protein